MERATHVVGTYAAPNDANGNPRTVFVLYETGEATRTEPRARYAHVVAVENKGYSGDSAQEVAGFFAEHLPKGASFAFLPTVLVTATEYRRLLRLRRPGVPA